MPVRLTRSVDWRNLRNALICVEAGTNSSRAGIAKTLRLSRTTVSNLAARLIEAELVEERTGDARGRGRPGIPLVLTHNRWYALGAEFHSRRWVFVITDLAGRVIHTHTELVPDVGAEAFLEGLVAGVRAVEPASPGRLLPAVGVGAPGLVDCERGAILSADDLGWHDVDVAGRLRAATGLAVWVANRHRASGLAEARFGAGRGVHSMVYVGIGTGISAAILLDGALLHGANYSAGEIGHATIDPDGPLCGCGKRGCLHTLASGSAIAAMARSRLETTGAEANSPLLKAWICSRGELSGEQVVEAAAQGDQVAIECLGPAAKSLGLAVANLITTINPDKVIIGGPIGQLGDPFVAMMRGEAQKWAMRHPLEAATIEAGSLGEYTGALGAACLVLDRKLDLVLGPP